MQEDSNSVFYNIKASDLNDTINLKTIKANNNTYHIANYNKTILNFNDRKSGEYRSVIFSFPDKKLLSFSPPKSIPSLVFMNKYPNITTNMLVTSAIEGVMITLFYDNDINKWEIATKGAVGGKYGYYGNIIKRKHEERFETPTFYRMFLDALRANADEELNNLPFLEHLPKNACYNFILQHPKNIIVLPVKEPMVYLIGVYLIDGEYVEYIPQTCYEIWSELKIATGIINYPKIYNNAYEYDDMEKIYETHSTGIMVTNIDTGERTKISSNKYEQIRLSIKIPTCSQYLYFCLRRINKVTEYLEHFPKFKKTFYKIRNEYEEFITLMHKLYVNKYVFKCESLFVNEYYMKWCEKIHKELFLPTVSKMIRTTATRKLVKSYFDKYEPRELLYIMNFDFR